MDDDDTESKKRKSKCTSYSKVSHEDAEERLGFPIEKLADKMLPVGKMLAEAGYTIKERIGRRLAYQGRGV